MLPVVDYLRLLTLQTALFLQWLYIASIIKNDVLISVLSPPELIIRASLEAQLVKNPPTMQETWIGNIPWRREWLPTPVFWPGEFHGLYSP